MWYLRNDGTGSTPLAWEQLVRSARTGQLSPVALVRREGWNEWHAAHSVRALFPEPFWTPGRLDRKALKGALLGGAGAAVLGGVIGAVSGDVVAAAVGAVVFAFLGAILGTFIGFVVWVFRRPEPAADPSSQANQPEPKPEPPSVWDRIGYVVGAIVLAVILLAKGLGPALSHQQNQPVPNQNQSTNGKPANPQSGR
jgi:hypothetical protein